MSYESARAYLDVQRPKLIDSAEDFGRRHRITSRTAIDLLRQFSYAFVNTPSGKKWAAQETQLDRIERMLKELLTLSCSQTS